MYLAGTIIFIINFTIHGANETLHREANGYKYSFIQELSIYRKHCTVSMLQARDSVTQTPPPLPAQAEASPQTAWRAASETRPWELLSFLENRKLQMVVIHFDSKCLLK